MIEKQVNRIKPKYYWALAYFLGSIAMFAMLSYSGRLGGKYEMLSGDGFKLVANLRMFARSIWRGESIWYSFATSLGMNTGLLIAYDYMSPFNIFYILFPNGNPNVLTAIVFILKTGAAAATFQLFSKKVLKQESIFSVLFGIFYSMCGFSLLHSLSNNMWGDAIYILPLVGIGVYLAVYENKYLLLTVSYALAFITQFYLGYMIGVISFLFFFLVLFVGANELKGKEKVLRILKYFLATLTAILVSAVIWLPAAYCLLHFSGEDATQFQRIGTTVLDLFYCMLWGRKGDSYSGLPYAYTGVATAMILPFFFFVKKIHARTKWIAGAMLGFCMLCFFVMPFYSLIHAFDAPDGFNYRFLFAFSMILCSIACLTLKENPKISLKWIIPWCALLLVSRIIMIAIRKGDADTWKYAFFMLGMNIVFMGLWVLFDRMGRVEKSRSAAVALALVLAIAETASAGFFMYKDMDMTTENSYERWDAYMRQVQADVKSDTDSSFYRIVFQNDYHDNSDAFWGFNGITDFGSAEHPALRHMLHRMGFFTSPRMMHATGITPVTGMLLGIKTLYIGDDPYRIVGESAPLIKEDNPYRLSLGFMVKDELADTEFTGANGFETLNEIIHVCAGTDDVFVPVSKDRIRFIEEGIVIEEREIADEDGNRVILSLEGEAPEDMAPGVRIIVSPNGEYPAYIQTEFSNAGNFENMLYMRGMDNLVNIESDSCDQGIQGAPLVKMKTNADGDYAVRIECYDEASCPAGFNALNVYDFHEENLQAAYEILSKEQLQVEEWKNGYVKGRISVSSDNRLLYTSIPYIDGWKITINGEEVQPVALMNGAFLGFYVSNVGDYSVEMRYCCPWLKEGVIISVAGVFLLLVALVFEKKTKERKEQ